MASYAQIVEWSKSRGFFESFRYTFGSYSAAAKQMRTTPKYLRDLAERNLQFGGVSPTDATVRKLQKMLSHVGKRKLEIAKKWPVVRQSTTPRQLERFILPSVAKGRKQQQYFMRQVEAWNVRRPLRYSGGQFYDKQMMKEYRYRWRLRHKRTVSARRRMKEARARIERAKLKW